MKTISKTALVALMAASVGLAGIGTSAFAQTSNPTQAEAPGKPGEGLQRFHHKGPGAPDGLMERRMMMHEMGGPHGPGPRGFGLLNFGSAEAMEIAFVRLSYAIDMNEDQQALFDTLKSDALAAQAAFDTATEDLRFDPTSGQERPDMVEIFNNRIAIESARLDAMRAIQPSFEAFFNSLTDEQKAELGPRRMQFERPGTPGGPDAPEAPEAPAQG